MKSERHGNYLIMGLVCSLLLLQWACTTDDSDVDNSKPYIRLSQHNLVLGVGQTATVSARLTNNQAKDYPANWSHVIRSNDKRIRSVSISPSSGASYVQITIIASNDFYPDDTERESLLGLNHMIDLTAVSADPAIHAIASIGVTPKLIQASMTSQRVSLDFAQFLARGKCTFNIENDSSASTYRWEVVSINGRVVSSKNPSVEFAFAESPAVNAPVAQNRSAEITWTQKLSLAEQGSGSLSFFMKVKATSQDGKVLLCDCAPGANTFYGNISK